MYTTIVLKPAEETLTQIPAHEIKSIECQSDGKKLIRTKGGSLWLSLVPYRFSTHNLELLLESVFQQMVEVPVRTRKRMYRPTIKC